MDFIGAVLYMLDVLVYFVPILPLVMAIKFNRERRKLDEMEPDSELLSLEQLEELEQKVFPKKHVS